MPQNLHRLLEDPVPEPSAVGVRQPCRALRGWWDSGSGWRQQQARAQLPRITGTRFSALAFSSGRFVHREQVKVYLNALQRQCPKTVSRGEIGLNYILNKTVTEMQGMERCDVSTIPV